MRTTIRLCAVLLPLFFSFSQVCAQDKDLMALFPATNFQEGISSPSAFFGFTPGQWHLSADQINAYCQYLARLSDRVVYQEYARSHEQKPLSILLISSRENIANRESLRTNHLLAALGSTRPSSSGQTPLVIYQGYSIHGDEASGANAAVLVAYYLAAGKGDKIEELLANTIILLDPCQNPDGLQRFTAWVNMHKNENQTGNDRDREFNQLWPHGRTNHYWFDLNRDWLPLQHPESVGKIRLLQEWRPHIVTDHHEMGSGSTFFFMPGVPSRTNPLTPKRNQEITGNIAQFHAKALDKAGVLYFSKESYDDFYLGKGSTYPDANGAIGILFEQAGTEGHWRKTPHGILSLHTAMRNQIITSLSTHDAALALGEELREYQAWFYQLAADEAKEDKIKAYLFHSGKDEARAVELVRILMTHGIDCHAVANEPETGYRKWLVMLGQPQYRLIKGIFESRTNFDDSVFYDVSAWTFPYAFGLAFNALTADQLKQYDKLRPLTEIPQMHVKTGTDIPDVGYIIEWDHHFAPALAHALLREELILSVLKSPGQLQGSDGGRGYTAGSIFIRSEQPKMAREELHKTVQSLSEKFSVPVIPIKSGSAIFGSDLGSNRHEILPLPRVGLLIGEGLSSYEAGELWFLFDQRFDIPVNKFDIDRISKGDLAEINTLLIPGGNFDALEAPFIRDLTEWIKEGGTLIVQGNAATWASRHRLADLENKMNDKVVGPETNDVHYADIGEGAGSNRVSGAILSLDYDETHPLCFGFDGRKLAIMKRGRTLFNPPENPHAAPIKYGESSLLSGYLPKGFEEMAGGAASLMAFRLGKGRVIATPDSYAFRAFFWGSEKILANAVFFAPILNTRSLQNISVPVSESNGQE